jgi:hypothetical protein
MPKSKAAHPARQRDLRQEGDAGAGHADGEGRTSHPLGRAMLAVQPCLRSGAQARRKSRSGTRRDYVFGIRHGHSRDMEARKALRGR